MENKFDSFLFKFDILGPEPKLNVFGEDKYKTKFSAICSIIVITILIALTINSVIFFFKYKNPSIIYARDNDKDTNRSVNIQDSCIFYIRDTKDIIIDDSKIYFEAIYLRDDNVQVPLTVERCKLGKNINKKKEEKLSSINLNDYYCIAENLTDYPLSYNAKRERSFILLNIKLNKTSNYVNDDDLIFSYITENDIVEHNDKKNPLRNSYYITYLNEITSNQYTILSYYFQYIKYESYDGLLFDVGNLYIGKYFSHSDVSKINILKNADPYLIGTIVLQINIPHFDYYNRSYSKIQTLLAEIWGVIQTITEIGNIICSFALKKK